MTGTKNRRHDAPEPLIRRRGSNFSHDSEENLIMLRSACHATQHHR
jgi:hypothetical protein